MSDRSARFRFISLIILLLALLVLFYRIVAGEVLFWGLPSLQFYPWRDYAFDVMKSGHLPFWNPFNGAGAPLLANFQSALLYPFNWIGLILPLGWSMSALAVAHMFIAGCGMWMFTGRLKLPDLGRGVSALSFGLTGYLVARLGTYPTLFVVAWMPWVLWAVMGILTNDKRRDIGWMAVFVGMQLLAGHAQTTWYSMVLLGCFSVWWAITHRVRWQRVAIVVAGLCLGVGLASIQLLPTAELLAQSQRSGGVDFETAMNFSYAPARILNFLSPNVFGTPANGSYATKGAYFEDAVYIGFIPLISAFVGLVTWVWGRIRKGERPAYFVSVPFWFVVVVVALVLALGKYSPVFPFLYKYVPTFSMFQAPVRWHILTVFGLSVLAGMGVGMWTRGYWVLFGTRLAIAAGIGAAILAGVAPRFLPASLTSSQAFTNLLYAVVVTGVSGAAAGVLTLLQPESPNSTRHYWWRGAVLLVIAVDLVYAEWGLNPTVKSGFYDQLLVSNPSVNRAYWPAAVDKQLKFEDSGYLLFNDYRVAVDKQDAYRASELPNINLIDRIPLLNNFEPLLVDSFKRYIDLIEEHPVQRENLLRAAGVDRVYDAKGIAQALANSTQRAWFVDSACWHPDGAFAETAMLADWDTQGVVHLVGKGDCPTVTQSGANTNTVQSIDDQSDMLVVKVNTDHAGWLVLADTYYPGWSASVDGVATEIKQANLTFRAVQVPTGAHEVRFEYHFRWMWPSILISLASLVVVVVLFRLRDVQR